MNTTDTVKKTMNSLNEIMKMPIDTFGDQMKQLIEYSKILENLYNEGYQQGYKDGMKILDKNDFSK